MEAQPPLRPTGRNFPEHVVSVAAILMQLCRLSERIRSSRLPALVGVQVHMAKTEARVLVKPLRLRREEGLQILVAGLIQTGNVLGQELHFLPRAPANDRVVAIQAHSQRFAIQHLLANVIFNHPLQFLFRRRPLPYF